MKIWKWFTGHHIIAPGHPARLPHVALGAAHVPAAPHDPWLVLPLAGAIVLTVLLLTLAFRRST